MLFPTLARFAARGAFDDLRATMANGMRQIVLLLIPAAAAILVLSEPMIRLVYQRGEFGARRRPTWSPTALFWFAFSLPFNGLFLLLTRTFFSLQRPWLPTAIAGGQPGDHGAVLAACSTSRSGSAGSSPRPRSRPPPASPRRRWSCAASSAASSSGGSSGRRRGCCSPPRRSPAVSYGVWDGLDDALGRGLGGQIVSLGAALPPARPSTRSRSRCCGSPRRARSAASSSAAEPARGRLQERLQANDV